MQGKRVPAVGPLDAKLYIVGEAPGVEEERGGQPFVGSSGLVLSRMLSRAGADRATCRINNVTQFRPPGNKIETWWPRGGKPNETIQRGIAELLEDIKRVRPNVVLALGATPLRALFGYDSILKWRGSHLEYENKEIDLRCRVIPTLHPAYILRQAQEEWVATQDIRRAWERAQDPNKWPIFNYDFHLRPSFEETCRILLHFLALAEQDKLRLAVDIETRSKQVACIGLASSRRSAICIPLMCTERPAGYFLPHEEAEVVYLLRQLLGHPNVQVYGHNWPYDAQYIARYWGVTANLAQDTMTTGHVIFSSLKKSLDFLSSIYLEDHIYWKDEGKEWDRTMPEERLWHYNCLDAVRTFAIAEEQIKTLEGMNHKRTSYGTPFEIQHRVQGHIFKAMLRGVRVDLEKKAEYAEELDKAIEFRRKWLKDVTGGTMKMANSPKQLIKLFYEDMGIKPVMNYHVDPPKPTVNDDALEKIKQREPLAIPICETVSEIRSLAIFRAICHQELDHDQRIRCSYIIPGTVTYRLASKEDAFGYGTNLQNISSGGGHGDFKLPNLRKFFIPDNGYIMGDYDGAQADARVVAWDAGDESLKEIFRDPTRDLHIENARAIFGACTGKSDPRRQLAKAGVHAANYLVSASELARHLGIIVHEADRFLRNWYGAHPAITKWHDRIRFEISSRRYVENAFGYRCYYFGRIDDIIKEAVAWIPQSTVGIMINIGLSQVCENVPEANLLLQTHDSANFQFPLRFWQASNIRIKHHMQVVIPYEDPLIIPIDAHLGNSWGACK